MTHDPRPTTLQRTVLTGSNRGDGVGISSAPNPFSSVSGWASISTPTPALAFAPALNPLTSSTGSDGSISSPPWPLSWDVHRGSIDTGADFAPTSW